MLDNPDIYAVRFFDKVWTLIFASRGKLAVLPVLSNMRSREALVMPPFAPALHPNLREETKSYLYFEKDFLNRDLTKLLEYLGGIKLDFMKEIHKNLSDESYKKVDYSKLLTDFKLKTPPINLDFDNGFPSVVGIAQERSRNRIDEVSKQPDNPEDIYPVYKKESLDEIRSMYHVIRNYPLSAYRF